MYQRVALLSPPFGTLTYVQPAHWPDALLRPGLRVAVPLGTGLRAAVLLEATAHADLPAGVALKPLGWPLESAPLLDGDYLGMVRQLALRQYRTEGNILGHMLPAGLRTTQVRLRLFAEGGKPQWFALKALTALTEDRQRPLLQALTTGEAHMLPKTVDSAASEICVLRVDPPWPVRPQAKRQIAVLDYLMEQGSTPRRRLQKTLGDVAPALDSLLKHGHVALRPADADADEAEAGENLLPPPPAAFALSQAQKDALDAFTLALDSGKAASHLLYGVTGSGKTAVYMELAKACLARGRSLLLLAPEVALALKLRRDAACALPGATVFLYHGYQSPVRREKLFRELARRQERREPCVVVGTRSALFLPLPALGAVVLDEEHDASFKQDEKLTYQAKEVAWFRVAQRQGLLVLGSATPDLKTFYAASQGHLPVQKLPSRVGGGTLPHIQLVNIAGQAGSEDLLAPESMTALKETLVRGEQAVVLLNRRGYAPLMYCLDCHKPARCPHCEIGLTYHKNREKLLCHYCGYAVPFPVVCPHCKGMHYLPMGQGTEKLAEQLSALVSPLGKVLRLDRDSTRVPGRMEAILEAFARQEAQVLVGTQMLSKGHHFPDVTLALVADGDLGLNLPDYRAAERTFQLLLQSAGRAGRGHKPGSVLIQTRDVSHYCWQYVQHGDYEGFYAEELARRERRRYPPFTHLALIRISFALDWAEGPTALTALTAQLRTLGREAGVTVLGPAPAPLALLRGQRRYHCLLKADHWNPLRQVYAQAERVADLRHMRLFLDLDPVNML